MRATLSCLRPTYRPAPSVGSRSLRENFHACKSPNTNTPGSARAGLSSESQTSAFSLSKNVVPSASHVPFGAPSPVFASASNFALIFSPAFPAASRFTSKRILLSSVQNPIAPPFSTNRSPSPTVRIGNVPVLASISSTCFLSPDPLMNKTWHPPIFPEPLRCSTCSGRCPIIFPFRVRSNAPRNGSSPIVQYVNGSPVPLNASAGHSMNWANRNKNAAFTSYSSATFALAAGSGLHTAAVKSTAPATKTQQPGRMRPFHRRRHLAASLRPLPSRPSVWPFLIEPSPPCLKSPGQLRVPAPPDQRRSGRTVVGVKKFQVSIPQQILPIHA